MKIKYVTTTVLALLCLGAPVMVNPALFGACPYEQVKQCACSNPAILKNCGDLGACSTKTQQSRYNGDYCKIPSSLAHYTVRGGASDLDYCYEECDCYIDVFGACSENQFSCWTYYDVKLLEFTCPGH